MITAVPRRASKSLPAQAAINLRGASDVCPVGVGQPDAPAGEERLQEPDGLQVGLDRAVRLVLGPEMPLEGAGQVG